MAQDPTILARLFAMLALYEERKSNPEFASASPRMQEAFLSASTKLGLLQEGDQDPWTGVIIDSIVRKSSKFIVFLDKDLRVRWWWVSKPHLPTVVAVQARINALTHDSAFLLLGWPSGWGFGRKKKDPQSLQLTPEARTIRSLIGEAMAMVLAGGTLEDCEKVLKEAERYIAVAKDQRCRPRFVWWFAIGLAAISGISLLLYRGASLFTGGDAPPEAATWVNAAIAGSFGALISAVSRTRDLGLEPAARNAGLAVEAFARALIGAAAGLLVNFAFEGGLLVKDALLQSDPLRNAVRLFLCVAGGISERVLPSLVGRAEGMVTEDKSSKPPKGGDAKGAAAAGQQSAEPPQPVG